MRCEEKPYRLTRAVLLLVIGAILIVGIPVAIVFFLMVLEGKAGFGSM